MARKLRIHFPGAFYHVMLRGNNRTCIFFSEQDRKYFYALVEEGIKRYCYRIHSFCLMDNHIHLLIQVADIPLSKIIQHLSFRFASYINFKKQRIGHLFQGRYKAILIDADKYLLELVRYIHLNPLRANMVDNAKKYVWSSHRAYLELENLTWLTKDLVLSFFDNRLLSYVEFINQKPEEESYKYFQVENQSNADVLADDEFMQKIKISYPIKPRIKINFEQIITFVCTFYSIDNKQLIQPNKNRHFSTIRAKIAWLAKEFSVCNFNSVARHFNRDPTGLIRVIRRLEDTNEGKNELNQLKLLIQKSVCQA